MYINKLWLMLILFLASHTIAEVTMFHGVVFYGDTLEVTFLDDTTLTYFEIGDEHFNLSNTDITCSGQRGFYNTVNVSYVNNSMWDQSRGWRIIEFNCTHTNIALLEWIMFFNSSNYIFDYYFDDVLTRNDVRQYQTEGYYSFNWTNDGNIHSHEWVFDGYSPDPPYNGEANVTIDANGGGIYSTPHVNLSWLRGNYSDQEVAVYHSSHYPTSPSDGTIAYNGTHLDYNFTVNQTAFFSIWSYNSTTNRFSRSGLQIPWGVMGMQCRNESKPWQNITFGVQISNSDGSNTYQRYWGSTTPFYINLSQVPYGDDTIILVNSTGYKDRVYQMDTRFNTYYNLTFYLPPHITEVDDGGGDTGVDDDHNLSSHLYYFQVFNEYNEPVGGVTVDVQRYINTTDSFESVGILITDESGMNSINLIPEVLYQVNLSAEGYISTRATWYPDKDYYGIYYPQPFYINFDSSSRNITNVLDIIFFNGSLAPNGTLTILYEDSDSNTTDTTFYIYENWNYTNTLLHTVSYTGNNDLGFWRTVNNVSRRHMVRLHINHSKIGYEVIRIYINPVYTPTDESEIEEKFTDVFGDFNLGWVKTFIVFLPCLFILVLFGKSHTGMAIIGSGLFLGFVSFFINMENIVTYGTLAGIFIVMGIVVTIVKKGRSAT